MRAPGFLVLLSGLSLLPRLSYADCSEPPATRAGERGADYVVRFKEWCAPCGTFVIADEGYRCDRSSPAERNPFIASDESRQRSREIREENAEIDKRNKGRDAYNRGNKYARAGKFEKALESYLEAAALRPEHADTQLMIHRMRWQLYAKSGIHEGKAGHYPQALALFEKAQPEDVEGTQNTKELIDWIHGLQEDERAKAAAALASARAIEERVRTEELQRVADRAVALFNDEKWSEAETLLRGVLAERPATPRLRDLLGTTVLVQKRYAEAEAIFLEGLRERPSDPDALHGLAAVQFHLGRFDHSEAIFREVLVVDSTNEVARGALEGVLSKSDVGSDSWNSRVQSAVKSAYDERAAWRARVREKLQHLELANDEPRGLKQLKPGDVILPSPEGIGSHLNSFGQALVTGSLFKGATGLPPSHSFLVIGRDSRERVLFLDNTLRDGEMNGTRVIGETEYLQQYGKKTGFVARPLSAVDGKMLLKIGIEASAHYAERAEHPLAGRLDTDYGAIGKTDMVCSETAGIAVLRAMHVPLPKGHAGPISILPADFIDASDPTGRWFEVAPLSNDAAP